MTKLFVAEFAYGKANLATKQLVKETPKIYMTGRSTTENLIGRQYLPDQLYKSKYHCFFTCEEALDYLLAEMDAYISKLELELGEAKGNRLAFVLSRKDLADKAQDLKGAR